MRPDPALQARSSSTRFTILRALVAALVLAVLAILPAICRGGETGSCCGISRSLLKGAKATTATASLADAPTSGSLLRGH